jgi:hypothetical protein
MTETKSNSYNIGTTLTGQTNWAIWKRTIVAYLKRMKFMGIASADGLPDTVTFPDDDGAMLTILMNLL